MLETPLGFGMPVIQCPEAIQYLEAGRMVDMLLETQPNPELREIRRAQEHSFAAKFQEALRWRV